MNQKGPTFCVYKTMKLPKYGKWTEWKMYGWASGGLSGSSMASMCRCELGGEWSLMRGQQRRQQWRQGNLPGDLGASTTIFLFARATLMSGYSIQLDSVSTFKDRLGQYIDTGFWISGHAWLMICQVRQCANMNSMVTVESNTGTAKTSTTRTRGLGAFLFARALSLSDYDIQSILWALLKLLGGKYIDTAFWISRHVWLVVCRVRQ